MLTYILPNTVFALPKAKKEASFSFPGREPLLFRRQASVGFNRFEIQFPRTKARFSANGYASSHLGLSVLGHILVERLKYLMFPGVTLVGVAVKSFTGHP